MKNILITGASAGFGAASVKALLKKGHRVVGIARRDEKLQELALSLKTELGDEVAKNFQYKKVDLNSSEQIKSFAQTCLADLGYIDVLINNAGLALGLEPAHKTNLSDWQTMVQTNVLGLINITHAFLPTMVERNSGQIINLGSTAGEYAYYGANVYGASKAFVKQFSLNLRADLFGTKVRVNLLEPGLCGQTEFSQVRFKGDTEKAAQVYKDIDALTGEDIAGIIEWLVELPEHVNVNALEVMPVAQSFAGLKVAKNS